MRGKYAKRRKLLNGTFNPDVATAMAKDNRVDKKILFPNGDKNVVWVRISEISMYISQDQIDENKVQDIINNWDPNVFTYPKVPKFPDGRLMMAAGHHRMIAFQRMGFESIPVYIIPVKSIQEVAKIYNDDAKADIKAQKSMIQMFPSLVAEGDVEAVKIAEVLKKYGYSFQYHRTPTSICAIKKVLAVEADYGIEQLDLELRCIHDGFAGYNYAPTSKMLGAMASFLNSVRNNKSFDTAHFIERLKTTSPLHIMEDIDKNQRGRIKPPFSTRSIEIFTWLYNYKKTKNRI